MKYNKIFMLGMLVAVCVLCGCSNGEVQMTVKENAVLDEADSDGTAGSTQPAETTKTEKKPETDSIYVYVCGHVVNPGVYALDGQARICDAIALAGGISEDGRGEALDQAEHMTDGQTLYVPGVDEEWSMEDSKAVGADRADGKVNINTASREELMTLPGIGESKAETIIKYREEHGDFESIEGLMEIPGIKEGIYNKIKEGIKVS